MNGVERPAASVALGVGASRRSSRLRYGARLLLPLIGPAAVLLVWHFAYSREWANRTLLPSPWATLGRLFNLLANGEILPDVAATAGRMFVGFALATVVGICVGLAMGCCRPLYDSMAFLVDFSRSIPVSTTYPIFILAFGLGSMTLIAMVFISSVFIIILNAAYGVGQTHPVRLQMAKLYGASRLQTLRWVVIFSAMGQTLIGLRVSLSLALVVEIVIEMFMGAQLGVGQKLFEAYSTYATETLFALVLLIGVVGYALNIAFVLLERELMKWNPA